MKVPVIKRKVRTGVVALVDALGFKGAWRRPNSMDSLFADMSGLVDSVEKYRTVTLEDAENWFARNKRLPEVRFLSDTLFIGLHAEEIGVQWFLEDPEDDEDNTIDQRALAIRTVSTMLTNFMRAASRLERPWAYRGVLAYGEFGVKDNFIAGPAVDEAAELFERANAAQVWLAPSALKLYYDTLPKVFNGGADDPLLLEHAVPFKDGTKYVTRVLNPVGRFIKRKEFVERILASFEPVDSSPMRIDVAIKRDNTMEFLNKALDLAKSKRKS